MDMVTDKTLRITKNTLKKDTLAGYPFLVPKFLISSL